MRSSTSASTSLRRRSPVRCSNAVRHDRYRDRARPAGPPEHRAPCRGARPRPAAFPVLLIVGSVAAADLSGTDSSAGVVNGVYFVAVALGAVAVGRAMDRLGRRPGLVASYVLLTVSGVGSAAAIRAGSYPGLLACTAIFGASAGGANLARAAVADMHAPEHRGRAVGMLLAAGTVGAVGGPFTVGVLQDLAEPWRIDPNVLPWVIVTVAGLAAAGCALAIRTDPRDL